MWPDITVRVQEGSPVSVTFTKDGVFSIKCTVADSVALQRELIARDHVAIAKQLGGTYAERPSIAKTDVVFTVAGTTMICPRDWWLFLTDQVLVQLLRLPAAKRIVAGANVSDSAKSQPVVTVDIELHCPLQFDDTPAGELSVGTYATLIQETFIALVNEMDLADDLYTWNIRQTPAHLHLKVRFEVCGPDYDETMSAAYEILRTEMAAEFTGLAEVNAWTKKIANEYQLTLTTETK